MTEILEKTTIYQYLQEVKDPEIPVISILELGMVRDVEVKENTVCVTITPSYSGCPAIDFIPVLIREKMEEKGIANFRIETKIHPPWTTDWISEEGKANLKAYGIAPPVEKTTDKSFISGGLKEVPCPLCQSTDTKLVSQFGSTPCKSAYQCKSCLEPFDYFKCH